MRILLGAAHASKSNSIKDRDLLTVYFNKIMIYLLFQNWYMEIDFIILMTQEGTSRDSSYHGSSEQMCLVMALAGNIMFCSYWKPHQLM